MQRHARIGGEADQKVPATGEKQHVGKAAIFTSASLC